MNKQQAQQLLGLGETFTAADLANALAAKRAQITQKRDAAPTEALKAKFDQLLMQLSEAETVLQPAKVTSSLSQTKLADLPSMAAGDAEQLTLQPGQILANRYRIEELLGQGGMGTVYRAFDTNRDEDIAIKLLLPSLASNERARERFMNEARLSSRLSHPNIVNVFDVQKDGDFVFLTMELLHGQDLRALMENQKTVGRPFDIEDIKHYITAVCEGLNEAHKYTVHRDIKPENLWFTDGGQLKIMDFGIAQVQSTSQRTQTGAAMGTAYYMAPEQLKGQKDIDGRADQYAVAVLAYELLTGEVPAGMIEPVDQLRRDTPKAMAQALTQALQSRPENRFADMAAFNAAFQRGKAIKQKTAKSTVGHAAGLPWGAIAVGALVVVLGIGLLMSGAVDVKSLLPASKEEIAAQKAAVARVQGEIKVLKERLNNGRRQLDSDVKDARRNASADLDSLVHWQEITENAIFAGNRITELEGELSMAETLLRENAFAPAQAGMDRVKVGYQSLWDNFLAGERLYLLQYQADSALSEWKAYANTHGLGDPQDVLSALAHARERGLAGDLSQQAAQVEQSIKFLSAALVVSKDLVRQRNLTSQAQENWQQLARDYEFGANDFSTQALLSKESADHTAKTGYLDSAVKAYQQATVQWQQAIESEAEQVSRIDSERVSRARTQADAKRRTEARAGALAYFQQAEQAAKQGQPDQVAVLKRRSQQADKDATAEAQWSQLSVLAVAVATKTKAEIEARVEHFVGRLVRIPEGSFMMGSNHGPSEEKPAHRVGIKSFKIMEHELTWAQYQPCIDSGACPDNSGDEFGRGWGKGDRPVINVSWDDITQHYIPWLNQQTGQRFRLPTEAEWEYAARAGSASNYSWGNDIGSNRANCDGCGSQWDDSKTAPVKSFLPNAFGLYDMHGNVWEWVQDCWSDSYLGASADGSARTSNDYCYRVFRGGSFVQDRWDLRVTNRKFDEAFDWSSVLGFRLVQAN